MAKHNDIVDVPGRIAALVGTVCNRGLPEVNAALKSVPGNTIQLDSALDLERVRGAQGCYSDNIGLAALEAIGIDRDVDRIATSSLIGAAGLVVAFGLGMYWAVRS